MSTKTHEEYLTRTKEGFEKEIDFIFSKSEEEIIKYLNYTGGAKHYKVLTKEAVQHKLFNNYCEFCKAHGLETR